MDKSLREKIDWLIKQVKCLRNQGGGSGGSETDTLETVVNRGNHSPKYITFTGGNTGENEINGALGMNTTTYSMYFGNMNPTHTGTLNIGVGYNTLNKLSSGTENTAFGHYSLSNLTVGTENIAIGNQTLNSLAGTDIESRWNIAIGENVGRYLSKASGNVFIGTYTAENLFHGVTEAQLFNISPAAIAYMKSVPNQSGYDTIGETFNTALNTFVGQGINEIPGTSTRAAMSTIIGASPLYNMTNGNFNNIIIGAGNYVALANSVTHNSIVIGNSVNLPKEVDVLAIGMSRAERINSQDAIIYGLLPNTQLTFNAPITVPSTYMRNAQGDSAYTKQLVATPNGDIGWEDKSVAGAWVDFNIVSPATANKARYRVKGDTVELELYILRVNGIGTTNQFAYIPTSIAPRGQTDGIFVHGYNVSTSQPVMMRIGQNGALTVITNTNTDALVFTIQYKLF